MNTDLSPMSSLKVNKRESVAFYYWCNRYIAKLEHDLIMVSFRCSKFNFLNSIKLDLT